MEAYVHGIASLAKQIYENPKVYPDRIVANPKKKRSELAVQHSRSRKLKEPSKEQWKVSLEEFPKESLASVLIAVDEIYSNICRYSKAELVSLADKYLKWFVLYGWILKDGAARMRG